jgi:hypothetical protein
LEWRRKNRERCRQNRRDWRNQNPDKEKEIKRRFKAKDPKKYQEQRRQANKRYRERNIDKERAYVRDYEAKNRDARNEAHRRWRAANPDKVRVQRVRDELKRASIERVRTSPEEVYRRAMAALPSGLPRFIRDDVVSRLCLAILEGEINVNDMAAQAKVYLRAYNREYDTVQTVSLDVLIPGTKTTYLDVLAAA